MKLKLTCRYSCSLVVVWFVTTWNVFSTTTTIPSTSFFFVTATATTKTTTTTTTKGRSLVELLVDPVDGSLLSKTALIGKAIELNQIVQPHYKRYLLLSDTNVRNVTTTTLQNTNTNNNKDGNEYTDSTIDDTTNISTEERVRDVCTIIEKSFVNKDGSNNEPVSCTCMGTLHGTLTINCDYTTSVCTTGTVDGVTPVTTRSSTTTTTQTCGKPQLGVTMVRGSVFSATTCVSEYQRNLVAIPDTCIFVNACSDDDMDDSVGADVGFCECTASYGGSICPKCSICNDGKSMSIDCSTTTNTNTAMKDDTNVIKTTTCQEIDLDFDLGNGAGTIAGFVPQFDSTSSNNKRNSFCTQLESTLNNNVTCDCSLLPASKTSTTESSSSSSFEITCTTTEEKCLSTEGNMNMCGIVSSSIQIHDGKITNGSTDTTTTTSSSSSSSSTAITSCVTYKEPFGETCTTFDFCHPNGNTDDSVCGCSATYNGETCAACSVCNDGIGIQIDCSNVYTDAKMDVCQIITKLNLYEFLPNYEQSGGSSTSNDRNSNPNYGSSSSAPSAIASQIIFVGILGFQTLFLLCL